jgi:hypothetical protein
MVYATLNTASATPGWLIANHEKEKALAPAPIPEAAPQQLPNNCWHSSAMDFVGSFCLWWAVRQGWHQLPLTVLTIFLAGRPQRRSHDGAQQVEQEHAVHKHNQAVATLHSRSDTCGTAVHGCGLYHGSGK